MRTDYVFMLFLAGLFLILGISHFFVLPDVFKKSDKYTDESRKKYTRWMKILGIVEFLQTLVWVVLYFLIYLGIVK